jgi:Protein of unknown function (DUF933)
MPMKIALFAISNLPLGKRNLKDPRLDQADQLVEAKKKIYAQVDLIGDDGLLEADAIIVSQDNRADLILKDLEAVETRLGRNPPEAEKVVLEKIKALLENDRFIFAENLPPEEMKAVAVHNFCTNKAIIVANPHELEDPDPLVLRAFQESGNICFLTVGGKENRAWPIGKGLSAWEAAGTIHSDIQKGFIRAEIISFQDFVQAGGETEAKRAGKQRLETKTYIMQDYDLTNFRFNK